MIHSRGPLDVLVFLSFLLAASGSSLLRPQQSHSDLRPQYTTSVVPPPVHGRSRRVVPARMEVQGVTFLIIRNEEITRSTQPSRSHPSSTNSPSFLRRRWWTFLFKDQRPSGATKCIAQTADPNGEWSFDGSFLDAALVGGIFVQGPTSIDGNEMQRPNDAKKDNRVFLFKDQRPSGPTKFLAQTSDPHHFCSRSKGVIGNLEHQNNRNQISRSRKSLRTRG